MNTTTPRAYPMEVANARVAKASSGELAFFLQEHDLCEAFCKWCDETPSDHEGRVRLARGSKPLQRLLNRSEDAHKVADLFEEGLVRGLQLMAVSAALDATTREE